MSHQIRVAHLIAPVSFGGGEAVLLSLLAQEQPGIHSHVVLIYRSRELEERLSDLRIPWTRLRNREIGAGLTRAEAARDIAANLVRLPALRRTLRQSEIDVVHAHGFPAVLLAAAVPPRARVYTHHGIREPAGPLERGILGHSYLRFHAVTAVSTAAADSFRSAFPQIEVTVVPNCVDPVFFSAQRTEPRNGPTTFVQVGRFVAGKNQDQVVRAIAHLPDAVRDTIRVVFVGDGPTLPMVRDLASQLGVSAKVHFMGSVRHDRLPVVLTDSDFGLFPCDAEAFGVAAAEQLAMGLPVLGHDTTNLREVVGDAGILLPISELAGGFTRMVEEGDLLRETARIRATRFHPAAVSATYAAIYRRSLGVV